MDFCDLKLIQLYDTNVIFSFFDHALTFFKIIIDYTARRINKITIKIIKYSDVDKKLI